MSVPHSLYWLTSCLALWNIAFYESISDAFKIWMQSATYNHCLFVIPISIYLILQELTKITRQSFSPCYPALIGVILLMAVWAVGFAGSINVFQHFAVFAILPLLIVASIGLQAAKVIWFPLIFILFSVPVGEELIPLFQEITADISVQMLIWSGIPIYREGLFIQVPEGRFLVAEACSGIRFFVSTVMLGSLCAYMFFSSIKKRAAFILFSILLPVIANAIRAYGIMLIGHLSGMEYAVGADHLIYGWVFFGLVTVLLVFTAHFFKETEIASLTKFKLSDVDSSWFKFPNKLFMLSLLFIFITFVYWKQFIYQSNEKQLFADLSSLDNISTELIKTKNDPSNSWQPKFEKADVLYSGVGHFPANDIKIHYRGFSGLHEAELISWENRIFEPDTWTLKGTDELEIQFGERTLPLKVLKIVSNKSVVTTIIYWYQVPRLIHHDRLKIKIWQAMNVLLGQGKGGAFWSISTNGEGKDDYLKDWLLLNYNYIEQAYLKANP